MVEQRNFLRVNVEWKAQINSDSETIEVAVHNISPGGLLLTSEKELNVGCHLLIQLPDFKDLQTEVAWRREKCYGLRFTDNPQKQILCNYVYTLWKHSQTPQSIKHT